MARRTGGGNLAAVETEYGSGSLSPSEKFSEALGFGPSSYGDMVRRGEVSKTVNLAAEALMRRQAPGTEEELVFIVRIVKGAPLVTLLENMQSLVLNDQRYLLVPAEWPLRIRAVLPEHSGNGADPVLAAEWLMRRDEI